MKVAVALAATISLALLTSCGSSGGSISVVPPVQAQSVYSNASLTGTYAFSLVSTNDNNLLSPNGGSQPYTAIGAVQFDGSGNITTSSLTVSVGSVTCPMTITGTYSIPNSGLGTATINFAGTSSNCVTKATIPFSLAAAQQGTSVLLDSTAASNSVISGTAIKQ